MTTNLQKTDDKSKSLALAVEQAITAGNLAGLTPEQKLFYYNQVCASVGLNPLTRPLDFIQLNGKLVLYAKKDATDQLRKLYTVSIYKLDESVKEGLCIVTAYARDKNGKEDSDMGAVPLPAGGEARANAIMKAVTKAKRRVTLSICGMGLLDETELDTIPGARGEDFNPGTAEGKTAEKTAALKEKVSGGKKSDPRKEPETVDAEVVPEAGPTETPTEAAAKQPAAPVVTTSPPPAATAPAAKEKATKSRSKPAAAPAGPKAEDPIPGEPEIEKVTVPFGENLGLELGSLEVADFTNIAEFYKKNGPGSTPHFKWFYRVFIAYCQMYSELAELVDKLPGAAPAGVPADAGAALVVTDGQEDPAAFMEKPFEETYAEPAAGEQPWKQHAKLAHDRIRNAKSETELREAWTKLMADLQDATKINAKGIPVAESKAIVTEANKLKVEAKARLNLK